MKNVMMKFNEVPLELPNSEMDWGAVTGVHATQATINPNLDQTV